jgi:hypothetical protein
MNEDELNALANQLVELYPVAMKRCEFAYGYKPKGWSALDQAVKENGSSWAYFKSNLVTAKLLKEHGLAFHEPADRQQLAEAWKIAKVKIESQKEADDVDLD